MALPAFSKQLLQEIQLLTLQARKLATSHLSGYYRSALKGTGMTFDKVREYIPGDDVRHIDWHVTARMSAPYVKQFREERHVMLMLLVDHSASMALAPPNFPSMYQLICQVGTLFATAAHFSGDAVGLLACGEQITTLLAPARHHQRAQQIATHLLLGRPDASTMALPLAAPHLASMLPRRSNVILLSDGGAFAEPNISFLRLLARQHHLVWIQPLSALHHQLHDVGMAYLAHIEHMDNALLLDTSLAEVRHIYQTQATSLQNQHIAFCQQHNISHFPLYVEQDLASQCLQFLRRQSLGKPQ